MSRRFGRFALEFGIRSNQRGQLNKLYSMSQYGNCVFLKIPTQKRSFSAEIKNLKSIGELIKERETSLGIIGFMSVIDKYQIYAEIIQDSTIPLAPISSEEKYQIYSKNNSVSLIDDAKKNCENIEYISNVLNIDSSTIIESARNVIDLYQMVMMYKENNTFSKIKNQRSFIEVLSQVHYGWIKECEKYLYFQGQLFEKIDNSILDSLWVSMLYIDTIRVKLIDILDD